MPRSSSKPGFYYDYMNLIMMKNKLKVFKPRFNWEWEEAITYPKFREMGKDAWIKLASEGEVFTVTKKIVEDIKNTDAADISSFNNLDQVKQLRVIRQFRKGIYELPIIYLDKKGLTLVGGNTRLTAMMVKEGEAKVWIFKV